MSKENEMTLEIYNKKAQRYLETTEILENTNPNKVKQKRENLEKFLKECLDEIPRGKKVLEIGAADGLVSKYIESLGYNVTSSDVAQTFIERQKENGLNAIKFNILEDEFETTYDVIFCWRVFVHFTQKDVELALEKIYKNLNKNGICIFNVMNKEPKKIDEEWIDFEGDLKMGQKRYYRYFDEKNLNEQICKMGYTISKFHKEGGKNMDKWLVYAISKTDANLKII